MSATASRPASGVRFAAGAVHPAGESVYVLVETVLVTVDAVMCRYEEQNAVAWLV
jgi:hypothetical protein